MTFVTKLTFQSGDRAVLEDTVEEIKGMLERKGVECKGPHSSAPEKLRVPLSCRLDAGDTFDPWTYTVYTRKMEIHGAEHIAREVGHMDFPDSLHVEIEVGRKRPLGYRRN